MNGVHRTCAETAAFHVAPSMQQPESATSTPLPRILIIRAIKGHSFRIICDMCTLSLLESREQRYIKAINNNNTAVARRRPRSICRKRRWQVTAKHAYTLRMWFFMKCHGTWLCDVHRTRRDGSGFMWHQPCQRCKYTTSVDI